MQTILIGLLVLTAGLLVLTAMCLSPDSTLAEGALAIGLPNNVVKDGFSIGDSFNQKTLAAAADPQPGTPGVGWAIARDKRMAESAALAKCEARCGFRYSV